MIQTKTDIYTLPASLAGMVVMAWNLWHTAAAARARLIKPIPVPIPEPEPHQAPAPLPMYG